MRPDASRKPVLLYLVTEDWWFVAHRLPMARAAQRAGFEVHVAARIERHRTAIEAEGFHVHPIAWRRGSIDPLSLLTTAREVRRLYRKLRPSIAHHVALQAVVVGSLAATGLPVAVLNAFTGLGFVFASPSLKARFARAVISLALPRLLNRESARVLVENADDRSTLAGVGIDAARIAVIAGSGVDLDRFAPLQEPAGPITVAFAARMVENKGVRTLIAAFDLLAQRRPGLRLLLAGAPDPGNPEAVPAADLADWAARPGVVWRGHVDDVRSVWADAHIAVLPSRGGEGVPMTLMEAAACGRPLVATDVPGCRDIARPGVTGLLVPPDDPAALADAIERLARDPDLRRRFGTAGRQLVEETFASRRVGHDIVAIYRDVAQLQAARCGVRGTGG